MNIKKGDIKYYVYNEFDGYGCERCVVKEIYDDHIILVEDDGTILWIDNDRISMCIRNKPSTFIKKKKYLAINVYEEKY